MPNRIILKYPLELPVIENGIPYAFSHMTGMCGQGFDAMHVGIQNGKITVWGMCMDTTNKTMRQFYCVGTGKDLSELPTEAIYIGTVQMGAYVWHIFYR